MNLFHTFYRRRDKRGLHEKEKKKTAFNDAAFGNTFPDRRNAEDSENRKGRQSFKTADGKSA